MLARVVGELGFVVLACDWEEVCQVQKVCHNGGGRKDLHVLAGHDGEQDHLVQEAGQGEGSSEY